MDDEQLSEIKPAILAALPSLDLFISLLENCGGRFQFDPIMIKTIDDLELGEWASYYTDKESLLKLNASLIYSDLEIDTPPSANISELSAITTERYSKIIVKMKMLDFEAAFNGGDAFSAVPPELVDELKILAGKFFFANIPMLLNILALMSHGASMVTLVQRALDGEKQALFNAVQVDKTVIHLDGIHAQIRKAQLSGDAEFLRLLAKSIAAKNLDKSFKYRRLWVLFSVLDEGGFLELPRSDLFDLFESLGVYGESYNIFDVGSLSRQITRFRKKRGHQT